MELDALCQELGLVAVYLHGSRVTGSARPDSDLDVAVLAPFDWEPERFDAAAERVRHEVERLWEAPDAHVQDLGDAGPHFRFRVITGGRLVGVGDGTALARFQARTFGEHWDEKIRMQPMLEAFQQRVREGRFAS